MRGWGRILLGSAPQGQHQEPGWGLTDLAVSAPHLMGENGSREAKQPGLVQLRKLRSLPETVLARPHAAQQQMGPLRRVLHGALEILPAVWHPEAGLNTRHQQFAGLATSSLLCPPPRAS